MERFLCLASRPPRAAHSAPSRQMPLLRSKGRRQVCRSPCLLAADKIRLWGECVGGSSRRGNAPAGAGNGGTRGRSESLSASTPPILLYQKRGVNTNPSPFREELSAARLTEGVLYRLSVPACHARSEACIYQSSYQLIIKGCCKSKSCNSPNVQYTVVRSVRRESRTNDRRRNWCGSLFRCLRHRRRSYRRCPWDAAFW